MKGKYIFYALFSIFLGSFVSKAQTEDPCHYTTEGRDFWFGMMQNRSNYTGHYLEITVTSRIGADFVVTYGTTEILIGNYSVLANSSKSVVIDYNILEAIGSEMIENKGIHLVSTNPVNVYALNYRLQSADVALIYPTESLGKEYFAMCYTPPTGGSGEKNSEFLIVAANDSTTVKITPSVDTDMGKKANVTFSIVLNKGQSFQVQSMNSNLTGQGDLTGSYITSNFPIAFFSGSKASPVPSTGHSYDHLFEQIPPTSAWGRLFYLVPLKLKSRDTYRVLAAEDDTDVKIDGLNTIISLNRGEYYEFVLLSSQASQITSTKKILLAQFCRSQSVDGGSGVGDPFMIILSPVSQKINDVTFEAYQSDKVKNIFYVNIIALTSEKDSILLDDSPVGKYFKPFPDAEYSYAQVQILGGTHQLRNTIKKEGFLAFIYGFGDTGSTESYGYAVGFNLDIQLDLGLNYVSNDTLVLCQGTDVKLEAGAYFEKYRWSTGDTTSYINAFKQGWYKITAVTGRGCQLSDSLYIKINDPKMYLGKDTSSCGPDKIILKASNGFESYLWHDGKTEPSFSVDKTGDYVVTGTNVFGCTASDTAHVDVFDVPKVKILGDTLYCGTFNADLEVQITNADTALWDDPEAAKWTSTPEGLTFSLEGPTKVKINAPKAGYYSVNYTLTTKNGCIGSDTLQIGFFNIPESLFEVVSPESTDKCSSYERIVSFTGNNGPTAKYTWNFGGLMVLDTIGTNQYKISIGANNPQRTIKLFVEEHGCKSPETVKDIGVNPNFSFGADQVHGCDSLCVQFKSEVMINDSVSYQWSFGDGGVSILQNPFHCYRDTGKYDVSLMVTNVIDGCRNGSIEAEMIKIFKTPVAKLSTDSSFCYSDTVSFHYLNKLESSDCTWFTFGNELISSENTMATFLLKNEISKIGFIVDENGCKCDTFNVEVKRKPNFDFETAEPEICQPVPVFLKALPYDPNLQFNWSVDTILQQEGDSLVHKFSKPGIYSVTLQAFSKLTGCSDQIIKGDFIEVYPLPLPLFDQNYKVATVEHPDISFTNKSEGAVSYLWDFGDGVTSEEENPLHRYQNIGEYNVILYANTDFGCVDTISSQVKIIPFTFYTPNAFRPDSEISENRIFRPVQEGVDPDSYHFQVFNRVGSTVFKTSNFETGWNGKMPNGTEAAPGIFIWIVKFKDVQGFDHLQKGTVMLVR